MSTVGSWDKRTLVLWRAHVRPKVGEAVTTDNVAGDMAVDAPKSVGFDLGLLLYLHFNTEEA